ncbi:MAG: choice-of-anchor tandem repeat GloVer-containing protein [Candidatus Korobacteraceae bacterium]
MRRDRLFIGLRATVAMFAVALSVISSHAVIQEKLLHTFNPNGEEAYPYAGLIADHAGNLYGTTYEGGIHGSGTVFELMPNGSGGWTQKVLHSFNENGADGAYPEAALIFDAAGNLYGTTYEGGIHYAGAVFELTPQQGGSWTEKLLHSFNYDGTDGAYLEAGLIFDGSGNLYGTTAYGGIHGYGAVFKLAPNGSGGWTETLLHSFNYSTGDGAYPYAGLTIDGSGKLYGTTYEGGIHGYGAVFELAPNGSGGWTETVLHSFNYNGVDGAYPYTALIFDGSGKLYGTTYEGGMHGDGAVFELAPNGSGGWTETILHSFNYNGADGANPYASLIFDHAGNLYGTTSYGGIHYVGAVFELSPNGSGGWTETILHSFNFNGTDGYYPYAGLISDAAGNLYSTTYYGGRYTVGTMFELSPNGSGGWTEKTPYSFDYNGTDGAYPEAGLISDAAGNFYGTTSSGGIYDAGTVFELSPNGSGGYTHKLLYSFGNGTDGSYPYAGLVLDGSGNLYGTTSYGGIHYYYGTVFELSPNGSGGWTETLLHSFNYNGSDGAYPYAGLIRDGSGNLYGTTESGGIHGYGTVFEFTPNGSGGWTETILHSFNYNTGDGNYPQAGLILDGAGNLYGTTESGGIHGYGTVFELSPHGGSWTETVLRSFNDNGADAYEPEAGLTLDGTGNLYGTTPYGGIHDEGAVFELTPNGSGGWIETVLHSFNENGVDGSYPYAGLIFDAAGNLYGTTSSGGIHYYGAVFELSPHGGSWTETVLHSFNYNGVDGADPYAGLILDHSGNLYGTTSYGGSGTVDVGAVFEITP